MDRLLSSGEVAKSIEGVNRLDLTTAILKTQLAKTDKEWVEWIEENSAHDEYLEHSVIIIRDSDWQAHKRSIGL